MEDSDVAAVAAFFVALCLVSLPGALLLLLLLSAVSVTSTLNSKKRRSSASPARLPSLRSKASNSSLRFVILSHPDVGAVIDPKDGDNAVVEDEDDGNAAMFRRPMSTN